MRSLTIPTISKWYFVYAQSGNPVPECMVKKLLADLRESGVLNIADLGIGICGKSRSADGNKVHVNGLNNKLLSVSIYNDSFKVITANYQEYIAEDQADYEEADFLASSNRMKAHLI